MTEKDKNVRASRSNHRRAKVIGSVAVLAVLVLAVVWLKVVRGGEDSISDLATFTAKRGPLTISVLESGTIKAREQIIIKNEVEGRTSIISLIPEGTHVKKGDLLVKLDASTLQDAKINQEISVQNANAAFINAQETLAVAENQAKSDIDVAELTLKFAQQDLEQYNEGQYPKDKKTAENDITLREEELTRAQETLAWSQKLYEEKYLSKTDLQADKLAVTRSNNNLELANEDLRLLADFTRQRNIDQLESDFRQAEMALERTKRKAKADVVQAEATLKAKELEYTRQQDKLNKIIDQLDKAEIYAPADGMVIYATTARRGGFRDSREPLDEGVEVFERQELIYLPIAASSMAEVDIHEASLEKVRLGLPVIITVDALPGQKFFGSVNRIAPLPDPQSMWMNPDLKVYQSDIYLEGNDPALRTGMSCKAEIIAEQYADAVYVPVYAVIRVGGKPTVYIVKEGRIEERQVEIGLDNNSMVRIVSGLEEGEAVLLTPPLKSASIEGGSYLSHGESTDSEDDRDNLKQRINERLEATNGSQGVVPDKPLDDIETPQGEQNGQGFGPQQMEQMRKRLENMSPEERQKEMEKMRERFQNMSDQEREAMQQRVRGSGAGQAGGPGQGQGRRGGGAGQGRAREGAGSSSRGAERTQ